MSRRPRSPSEESSYTTGSSYYTHSSRYSYSESVNTDYTADTQYTITDEDHNAAFQPAGPIILPCELYGFGCDASFDFDQTELWIEHVIRHIYAPPVKAGCWFCDTFDFDSRARGHRGKGDPYVNFHNRMVHIREHILQDGKTVGDIRPDFHMIDHLRDYGVISQALWHQARGFDELPIPSEQLAHVRSHGFKPPERLREERRSNEVRVDNNKDDRNSRKDRKDKKNKASSRTPRSVVITRSN